MNVTYVYADGPAEWNSAGWRCAIPAEALNKTRRHRAELCDINDFRYSTQAANYHCKHADTIVVQRHLVPDAWEAVAHWRGQGKIVLVDIDDGYPQLLPDNPAYGYWHLGHAHGPRGEPVRLNPPPITKFWEGAKKFDGLTSPNRLICQDAEAEGVQAAYIPNWCDTAGYLRFDKKKHDRYRILWGGSVSHAEAWLKSGLLYALARVITARPEVELAVCGADTRVSNMLPIKSAQLVKINWVKFEEWPGVLATADLGLAPMGGTSENDIYDARRSWLKPLEFSLMGIPWLASRSPAYAEYADYGRLVENTPEAWSAALSAAIDQTPDETRLRRARQWAKDQDISLHVDEMCSAYERFRHV